MDTLTALKELLADHQPGMSQFQDDYLVVQRAGGTLYGQYKQALRELYSRFNTLQNSNLDQEKTKIEMEQLQSLIENDPDSFEGRLNKIELIRKENQYKSNDFTIHHTLREFTRFFQLALHLKSRIGDLTDEKRLDLDKQMWLYKIKEMICIDWISKGRIGNVTFEFINACPKEMKSELLTAMKNQSKLLDWYESKENDIIPDELPDVPSITYKEILSLTN